MAATKKFAEKRRALRDQFFPGDKPFEPPASGFIKLPRTVPLILGLLVSKKISGDVDPGRVYIELLGRCMDSGFVELGAEADHAFAAGYVSTRAVRTWQERMAVLEKAGFIKTRGSRTQKYKYVLIVDIDTAVDRLRKQGKVAQDWYDAYTERKLGIGYAASVEPEPVVVPKGKRGKPGSLLPSV